MTQDIIEKSCKPCNSDSGQVLKLVNPNKPLLNSKDINQPDGTIMENETKAEPTKRASVEAGLSLPPPKKQKLMVPPQLIIGKPKTSKDKIVEVDLTAENSKSPKKIQDRDEGKSTEEDCPLLVNKSGPELEDLLGLLKKEMSKRFRRWRKTRKMHDRKLSDLDRYKKKLAKSQENYEADQVKTKELKETLERLQNEERELEQTGLERSKKMKAKIAKAEREVKELRQQLEQGVFAPKKPQKPAKKEEKRFKTVPLPSDLKPCETILKRLDKLEYIYVFEDPVDITKYTDYLTIVKKSMCLETVRENLYGGKYTTMNQFAKDTRLVFANARIYNPSSNPVHRWAIQYSDVFEDLYRRATSLTAAAQQQKRMRTVLTPAEIDSLQNKLAELPSNSMEYVVDFLRRELPETYHEDEITIDLDLLPDKILLKLQELVLNEAKMKPRNRAQKRQRIKRQIENLQGERNFGPPPQLPPPFFPNMPYPL